MGEEVAEFSGFLEMELPGRQQELSGFALSESRPSSFPSVEFCLSEALHGSEVAASSLISSMHIRRLSWTYSMSINV